jgi:molybdate transport system ATP-binding protein
MREDELKIDFCHLSFGQQKLILLCRAVVKRPRLLLLDEPTHGLSSENRARLLGMLGTLAADPSVAIVLVTHRKDEIEALGFEHFLRLDGGERTAEA